MASTGEVWKLGHRPALDGLRGIAVLLVIGYHAMPTIAGSGGSVGVTMFFTLSGFLITALLDQEYAHRGRIDIRAFFARRARRLLPALALLLVGVVTLRVSVHPQFAENRWLLGAVFYFNNWNAVLTDRVSVGLEHTWSLAIEEQFYLLFPLVAAGLLRRREWMIRAVAVGVAMSFALRVGMWATGVESSRWYYGTDTTVGLILIGALAALVLKHRPPVGHPRMAGVIVIALAAAASLHDSLTIRGPGMALVAVATAAVLVMLSGPSPAPAWLASPALRYVGRRSYGLYLWHMPMIWVLVPLHSQPLLLLVVASSLTFGIAELSWRLVERPLSQRRIAYTPSSQESMVSPTP